MGIIHVKELDTVYSRIMNMELCPTIRSDFCYEVDGWVKGKYNRTKKITNASLIDETGLFLSGFAPKIIKLLETKQKVIYERITFPIPDMKFPHLPDIDFRDDQLRLIRLAIGRQRGVLVSPTGCISGDTVIRFNRAKKGYTQTIKKAFEQQTDKRRKKQHSTKVRSYDQNKEKIHLHDIMDIVYSGEKFCLKLLLSSGKFLIATPDHKIMTNKGWVELQNLNKNLHLVMTDTPHAQSQLKKKKSRTDVCCVNLWYHPYASILNDKGHNCREKGYSRRAEKHRCIYEAHLNKMTLDDFLFIVRNDPIKSSKLKFVNPKKFHIHHKDENHKNNAISNLECIPCKKHLQFHAKKCQYNFHQGIPVFEKIISIVPMGIQHTYDIRCEEPYHNFVANDIVVHNSGKTIVLLGIMSAFPTANVLYLANTIDLVDQAILEMKKFGFKNVTKMGGGLKDHSGQIVVSTLKSLAALDPKEYCDKYDMVIADECHHAAKFYNHYNKRGGDFCTILSNLFAPLRFGVTATLPTNTETKHVLEGLVGGVIGEVTFDEARELGILATPKVTLIPVDRFDDPEVKGYQNIYEYAVVRNRLRNKSILKKIKELNEQGLSTVTYVQRTDHINRLMEMSTSPSINVKLVPIQGKVDSKDRLLAKQLLEKKEIMNVVATVVWREGINIKSLNAIIIAGGGKNEKDLIQACGRGARKDVGKDEFIIVDFIDSAKYLSQHVCERLKVYIEKGWL